MELYFKPLRYYEGLVSLRQELTSEGLGNVIRSTNADINFRYQVWWTTPVEKAH